jgi:hypothetical protein
VERPAALSRPAPTISWCERERPPKYSTTTKAAELAGRRLNALLAPSVLPSFSHYHFTIMFDVVSFLHSAAISAGTRPPISRAIAPPPPRCRMWADC